MWSAGDGRGDVPASIEERRLAQRRAGPLAMEDLLPAAERDLADLDRAVGNDEEPAARRALLEQELTGVEHARDTSGRQVTEFSGRQEAKVPHAGEELRIAHQRSRSGHCAPPLTMIARGGSVQARTPDVGLPRESADPKAARKSRWT